LTPTAPLLSKPIQVRRNQGLYITSKIQFNSVQQPSSIIYQWTVFTCSTACTNPIQLSNVTQKELFIGPRTLSHGIYEVKLTVTTIDISSTLSSSSSVYVQITDSNIITNLVLFDRLTIRHNSKEALVLDPGKYSIDPNKITFHPHVSDMNDFCTFSLNVFFTGMELYLLLSNL
jgi:hypothetical protein